MKMLCKAMNKYQVVKRDFKEQAKNQYNAEHERDGAKTFFRASELGSGDRRIIYGFFKHQLPTTPKSAKNLRALENGDFVHLRWQRAWDEMGIMISPQMNANTLEYDEIKLSSTDDEYLAQFPWVWQGHYDALLDLNIVRAHAEGLCTVTQVRNEDTGMLEMEVTLDESYANEIGIASEDYEPLKAVADIKSMNQWGFKRLVEKAYVSEISGYIDQIMFYMYMLNTPYGFVFVEDKGSNDICEVQVVWKDLHEGETYGFEDKYHGAQEKSVIRLVVTNERFYGSDTTEGMVQRIDRLWTARQALVEAQAAGDSEALYRAMPIRCSSDAGKFPCSWGGGTDKCEFYDHCWNKKHQGTWVIPYEDCPAECKWQVNEAIIDSRKLPAGMTLEMVTALMNAGAFNPAPFLVEAPSEEKSVVEAMETAITAEIDDMFGATGELKLDYTHLQSNAPAEAVERLTTEGVRAIDCLNCGKEVSFARLGSGYTKKCPHCGHVNRVKQG